MSFESTIKFGNRIIGKNVAPFVIAEACINHEGDIDIAEQMILTAKSLNVDCIKFQIHVLENEMLPDTPLSGNFTDSLWETLEKTNFSLDEHRHLKSVCERVGIQYLCTPFSRDGADLLDELGVEVFKTGSGEMTNLPLLEHIASKKKPMIVSTGMAEMIEVEETVRMLKGTKTPFMLTHCTSAYPCPHHLVNLDLIPQYEKMFQVPIGLSDHSEGIYTSLGAVALGAVLIEKHFTFDRSQQGPDHASSIEPFDLGELVKGCKAVFDAKGSVKRVHEEEREILKWARESVVTEKIIEAGEVITEDMVWVKRPASKSGCVPAKDFHKIIGKKTVHRLDVGQQIRWKDLLE